MPKAKLTAAFVRKATCPDGKARTEFFDTDLKGFVLEVRKGGGKTFYARYRDPRGTQRQLKVGPAAVLTVEEARSKAKTLLSQVALGGNPLAEREILRSISTLADFARDRYMPHIESYKKSWFVDEALLRIHILPFFGNLPLDKIDVVKINQFRECLSAKGLVPTSSNRVVVVLRYLFTLAVRWETPGVTKNPFAGVPQLKEINRRERYLTPEETQRLYTALLASNNTQLRYIIPMLILSGARKREVMDARWEDFDFERQSWRIPKTKSGKPRHVPISDAFAALLATIPKFQGCPFVVPNPATLEPYGSFFHCWNLARREAGLADVRIHDLRHSFASFLVNAGRTIYEVKEILGHAEIKTTQRYAHLSPSTLLAAANSAGDKLAGIFTGQPQKCEEQSRGPMPTD